MAANFADKTAAVAGAPWPALAEAGHLDDGVLILASAAAMRPNPWGFHHMHGNVWEWVRDSHCPYSEPGRDIDGLREMPAAVEQIARGASLNDAPSRARSANRSRRPPGHREHNFGARLARPVLPDAF